MGFSSKPKTSRDSTTAQRIKERYEANLKGNREDLKALQDSINNLIIKLQDRPELLKDTRIKDSILKMKFE